MSSRLLGGLDAWARVASASLVSPSAPPLSGHVRLDLHTAGRRRKEPPMPPPPDDRDDQRRRDALRHAHKLATDAAKLIVIAERARIGGAALLADGLAREALEIANAAR